MWPRLALGLVLVMVVMTTPPAAPAVAAPQQLVVAPWGSPDARGTSEDPLGSLAAAFSRVGPGDGVLVRGGTYAEDVIVDIDADADDAPVVVAPWPGEAPVLHGRMWLRRPSNWHISGLEITWRDDLSRTMHLVKMTGGTGWALDEMIIRDARSFAALLVAGLDAHPTEPSGWRVTDSCITDTWPTNGTNQDHLVYVNAGLRSGGGLISGNVLSGARNGTAVKLGGPTVTSGGATNVVVSNNYIDAVAQGVLIAGRSHDNRVIGNSFGPISEPYAAIRSFRLDNDTNVARGNTAYGAALFQHYDSPDGRVLDGGTNQRLGPDEWESRGGTCPAVPAVRGHFVRGRR